MNNHKYLLYIILFLVLACVRVPITKRRQVNILPESTMISMSLTNYRDFLAKHEKVADSDINMQLVKKAGERIRAAAVKFLSQNKKYKKRIKGFKWEFNVVKDDKTVNAWCMPGGKVVVYTGLLPVTQTESALAAVLGHEIAHAIARHGNERMSQGLLVGLGGIGLAVALAEKPEATKDLFLQSYGITSTLGILAYSRQHESEADHLGLVFMAIAGYNPQDAVSFWERMAKTDKRHIPQFLSTHPSDEKRISNIKALLPMVMKYYEPK